MILDEYISDEKIIDHLCKQRIKQAEVANDFQYAKRLVGIHSRQQTSDLNDILPPRRSWAHFRPKDRGRTVDVDLASLRQATNCLRQKQPELVWVRRLNEFIEKVQSRIMDNQAFKFGRPAIKWELKEKNKYRALCRFPIEDNLIIGLVARYIREFCDPAFEGSSFAFRARSPQGFMPTYHTAFETIYQLRIAASTQDLFVAECDIQGFYDSVDHQVAMDAFARIVNQVESQIPNRLLDPRVERIYRAFLNCYSFPDNVLGEAESRLKAKVSNGCFPWPEKSLRRHHSDPRSKRIGVPQGGALSCVIANLVLDYADKRIEAAKVRLGADLHYLRYCDDMILLGNRKSDCKEAFQTYLDALYELKLPYHPAKTLWYYDRDFWQFKSKAPYCWTGRKGLGCVPWVQFVGYQIRHDGLTRVKKKSTHKQMAKVRETTDKVKFAMLDATRMHPFPRPYDPPSIMATKGNAV